MRWLAVEYRFGAEGEFRRLPLADVETAADLPAAFGGGLASGPLRPPLVVAGRAVPISAFTKPDGTPPADGDTITLRAAAADWDSGRKDQARARDKALMTDAPGLVPSAARDRSQWRAA